MYFWFVFISVNLPEYPRPLPLLFYLDNRLRSISLVGDYIAKSIKRTYFLCILFAAQFEIQGGVPRWGTRCAYDFRSDKNTKTGTLFSPRYPQNYPPDENCQYYFFGEDRERVKLVFKNVQLENIDGR